jgi:recombination protein RecA
MPLAAAIRVQVESALAKRVPSALTPIQRFVRPVLPTGISAVDALIGGFPVGAISELTGPESSGRTSLALAFLARVTQQGGVCAWIDPSDTLHGESAAGAGVDLDRLLWVRCGVHGCHKPNGHSFALPEQYLVARAAKRGLHGGGFGPHPRTATKGLSEAMGELFRRDPESVEAAPAPRRIEYRPQPSSPPTKKPAPGKPWGRIEQALKATDLLLQAGGFGAVVLDLAGMAPEYVSRVELSVWFRYRAAVERTQTSLVLMTKHPCAKSVGELLLRLHPGSIRGDETTTFTGVEHWLEIERRRFTDNVITLKKPSQSTHTAWKTHPTWEVGR